MSLDENLKVVRLIDAYGQMLTERQRTMMTSYYFDNLTLSEIGENLGVSRQAVNDCITQSIKSLESYEEKIGLISLKNTLRADLESIKSLGANDNLTLRINDIIEKLD